MVRPASRMSSAISFGVFLRLAPSTIEIIRSRKLSPGLAVIWMISQSDSTVVPPVTALRSPPLSRMTGALSPVIALSLTDATPSMISPSPGMTWPASTSTRSPGRSCDDGFSCLRASRLASVSTYAGTSLRALRSASACALPRPSAIASAKLANSTVNHSQTLIAAMKPGEASPAPVIRAWKNRIVVKALPISTTNMTGFRIMRRGSSLPNASRVARRTIGPSNSGRAVTRG